jgi:major type 1 subunit fimbrin (pilin)
MPACWRLIVAAGAATGVAINLMTADKADLPLHGSNSYSYPLAAPRIIR